MKQTLRCCGLFLISATNLYAQVGIGTNTPQAFFNVAAGKDVLFGDNLNNTANTNKLIWYAGKGAFRAGYVDDSGWNLGNVGQYSLATGNNTKASADYSTALGLLTTASGQAAVSIGYSTTASATTSIAMGYQSLASKSTAIALGYQAVASGDYAAAIGYQTTANGEAAVSLGFSTTASGGASTAMGNQTLASKSAAIATGYQTKATGNFSTAMGNQTTASGDYSTALGANVSTNGNVGSFIIGDYSTGYVYNNSKASQMMMRFTGGYMLYSSAPASQASAIGVQLLSNGNAWTTISDSTRKENFRKVDGAGFLQKIARMRLGSWNYKGQNVGMYRHYGPMAQDFFAAFGHDELGVIGEDKSINQADFDGVNLIAIQALIHKIEKLEAENSLLRTSIKEETSSLRSELETIKRLLNGQAALTINSVK